MRRCGSDTFRGGQSHADHRRPGRSHRAMIDKLPPKMPVGGGLLITMGIRPVGNVRMDHLFPGGYAPGCPGVMVTIFLQTGRI